MLCRRPPCACVRPTRRCWTPARRNRPPSRRGTASCSGSRWVARGASSGRCALRVGHGSSGPGGGALARAAGGAERELLYFVFGRLAACFLFQGDVMVADCGHSRSVSMSHGCMDAAGQIHSPKRWALLTSRTVLCSALRALLYVVPACRFAPRGAPWRTTPWVLAPPQRPRRPLPCAECRGHPDSARDHTSVVGSWRVAGAQTRLGGASRAPGHGQPRRPWRLAQPLSRREGRRRLGTRPCARACRLSRAAQNFAAGLSAARQLQKGLFWRRGPELCA